MAMVNSVEIDDADDTLMQYEHSITDEKQIMTVDFELNKVNAMNKKIAACDKENYKHVVLYVLVQRHLRCSCGIYLHIYITFLSIL